MEVKKVVKGEFAVIGHEGSTREGAGFIQNLWQKSNEHFSEVAALAIKDENGAPVGLWGAMSDFSRQFKPWENGFTEGLYIAGIEADMSAEAPEGWTKWVCPASEYLKIDMGGITFQQALDELKREGYELVGAAYDFNDPNTGKYYNFLPIKRL